MKPFLAHLDITSFTYCGSIGAEHFYGKISFPYDLKIESFELQHPLSQKEALYLNKKDNCKFERYRPGQLSNKFETKEELIRFAYYWFKKNYPDSLLLLGDCVSIYAKKLIYWPKNLDNLAEKVNNLANEYDKLPWSKGYYSHCLDEEKMDKINDEWDKLMEKYL